MIRKWKWRNIKKKIKKTIILKSYISHLFFVARFCFITNERKYPPTKLSINTYASRVWEREKRGTRSKTETFYDIFLPFMQVLEMFLSCAHILILKSFCFFIVSTNTWAQQFFSSLAPTFSFTFFRMLFLSLSLESLYFVLLRHCTCM